LRFTPLPSRSPGLPPLLLPAPGLIKVFPEPPVKDVLVDAVAPADLGGFQVPAMDRPAEISFTHLDIGTRLLDRVADGSG
jgi:hypothetical protein